MLLLWLLHFAGEANGQNLSECIPGAVDLGPVTLKNTPYFSNKVYTPLQMSIMSNDTDTAYGFLREMSRSNNIIGITNTTDRQGMKLLHWAAFEGNVDMVKSLLCFGANARAVDIEGNTPLHLAAQGSRSDTVRELISSGSFINVKNSKGETPLHLAIKSGAFSAALALLGSGALTDVEDSEGRVALDVAFAGGNRDIIRLLRSAGVKSKSKSEPLYQWKDERGGWHPVVGGRDDRCLEKVYVGRVHYEEHVIPVKVCHLLSRAYIVNNGIGIIFKNYEILDSEHVAWVPMHEGKDIPSEAFVGGMTKDGEKLYIGRGNIIHNGENFLTPGKVTSDKILHVLYFHKEYTFKNYEILILHKS